MARIKGAKALRAQLETAAWANLTDRQQTTVDGARALRERYGEIDERIVPLADLPIDRLRAIAYMPERDHVAFPLLLEQCEATGLPLSFRTDVTNHDRWDLARNSDDSSPFVWALGEHGSHLCWIARESKGSRAWEAPWGGSWERWARTLERRQHFYLWDGVALRAVEPADLDAAIDAVRERAQAAAAE